MTTTATQPTLRLGVSSYSYWHFTPEKVPLSRIVDSAADAGVMGLEILHQHSALVAAPIAVLERRNQPARVDGEQRLGLLVRINLDVLVWDTLVFE